MMAPGTCSPNRWAIFHTPSVRSLSPVSCDEGLHDVWSQCNPRLRLRGSHPWLNMWECLSYAVVVVNARPALWDELAREHAEAWTQSVRNRCLLDWSVMKGLLACLVGDEGRPVVVMLSGAAVGLWAMLCPITVSSVVQWPQAICCCCCCCCDHVDHKVACCSNHVRVTNMGEVSMCGYIPHINRLFVVFTHCTSSCSLEHNGLETALNEWFCPTGV
jgi:hypothetical protein